MLTLHDLGIKTDQESLARMPAAQVSFDAGSFIAPFYSDILYSFMTQGDWNNVKPVGEEDVSAPFFIQDFGEWKTLYYRDYDRALYSTRSVNPNEEEGRRKPRAQWVLYTATSDVMNVKDLEGLSSAWGDQLTLGVRIMTLRKGSQRFALKNRHSFALLALPSAVAAIADALGIDNAGFDLSELTQARDDGKWTNELWFKLVGHPEGEYEDSVFAKRRAALWASLGESDPRNQAVKGSLSASGKPNNLATDSDNLSTCLSFVQGEWTKPLYLRVTNVKDPRTDALNKSGRRLTIPCITEIFANEAAALAAAQADLSEDGDDAPPLPANWVKYRDEWIDHVTKLEIPDGPPNKVIEDASATIGECRAWKEYLGVG